MEASLDITELKLTEAELQKLNRELEKRVRERTIELEIANKELDAFSYSVSHDLRSPLRRVEGFGRALWEEYGDVLDEQGKDYLNRICSSSKKMEELIDDLLQLSRVTRLEIKKERVDLSATVKARLGVLQEQEPQRQVKTTIEPGVVIKGDRSLISIVIENLLNNAWKYTGNKTPACIEFGVFNTPDGHQLYYIRDNGIGFDMDYAHNLFNAFQRLHGDKDYPGTGIGLSIVVRIVRRHGGDIKALGVVNEGAVFCFSLTTPQLDGIDLARIFYKGEQ